MKKIISIFICLMLLISTLPFSVFASEYESIIDNADFILSDDETQIQTKIDYIKEEHNYNITLISGDFENKDALFEYGDNFSSYDINSSGTILIIGEYEGVYNYYSIPYGEYSNLLNDNIFADFEEFDATSETYAESYDMYVTLVQNFLEKQQTSIETIAETSTETVAETTIETVNNSSEPLYEVSFNDEVGLLSDKDKDYFERRIETLYEKYNYIITLSTKDYSYSDSYSDYTEFSDDLISQSKKDTEYTGSVIVFAPHAYNDFYFINAHYGEYRESMLDKMFSFYNIENYAREDEENIEDMCFYTLDTAINRIEEVLEEENKTPLKPFDEYVGVGEKIGEFDPMIDAAEIFSDEEEEQLFARIEEIKNAYDFDVTIITMQEIPDDSYDLRDYFDWYEGLNPTRDGLVVGVNMNENNREFSISARNFGMDAFTEDAHFVIDKNVPPLLTNMEYSKAFNMFLDYTEEFLATANDGKPYKKPIAIYNYIIFIVALPLIIAMIIAWAIVNFVFVAQMKTAVIKTQAKDFMKKNSLVLTVNTDVFSHETETREYDPPSETKGGGGGGGRTESSGYGGGRSGSSSSF